MTGRNAASASDLTVAELLAHLQSVGATEREVRAPDALQARLQATYLRARNGRPFALLPFRPQDLSALLWSALARLPAYSAVCAACVVAVVYFGIDQSTSPQRLALPAAAGAGAGAHDGRLAPGPVTRDIAAIAAAHQPAAATGASVLKRTPSTQHRAAPLPNGNVAVALVPTPIARTPAARAPVARARLMRVHAPNRALATTRSVDELPIWQVPVVAEGITTRIPPVALRPPALSTQLSALAALNLSALPAYAPAIRPAPDGARDQAEPVDLRTVDPTRLLPTPPGVEPAERPAADARPGRSARAAVVDLLV